MHGETLQRCIELLQLFCRHLSDRDEHLIVAALNGLVGRIGAQRLAFAGQVRADLARSAEQLVAPASQALLHFLLRATALVAFSGGYGTLDEVFESLNLVQTRKIKPIPIVLVGAAHWQRLIDFDYLIDQGFIDESERSLATMVDTGAEAARVILDFHRVASPPT